MVVAAAVSTAAAVAVVAAVLMVLAGGGVVATSLQGAPDPKKRSSHAALRQRVRYSVDATLITHSHAIRHACPTFIALPGRQVFILTAALLYAVFEVLVSHINKAADKTRLELAFKYFAREPLQPGGWWVCPCGCAPMVRTHACTYARRGSECLSSASITARMVHTTTTTTTSTTTATTAAHHAHTQCRLLSWSRQRPRTG
jgi:hypothetical protein